MALAAAVMMLAVASPTQTPTPALPELEQRLQELERRARQSELELATLRDRFAALDPPPAAQRWFERLSIRGYGQLRYTARSDSGEVPALTVPNDRSVADDETFVLRRGRVVVSGDVSEHVSVYVQADFAASAGDGDLVVQMRDYYADIALDDDGEFRFRAGVSKVPYGFTNLQSSSDRAPLERVDGISSALDGERDFGVFFQWAPRARRELLRELARSGLKGSGDYGCFAFGPYSGQGLNRSDRNDELHWVARFTWPFELADGQAAELALQGYHGEFVPSVEAIGGVVPTFAAGGVRDERVGVTAVLYPQPFGLEAEWNWGHGPTLSRDGTRITSESLQGGYVQASWRIETPDAVWFPFVRWHRYDGGRKFGRNAPRTDVEELDVGCEFSPWSAVELTVMYTHTFARTDTTTAPYDAVRGEDRLGLQVQFEF